MRIEITQPDDWHLHLRDGEVIKDVVADSARQFGRAIVMPNLKPPVTTTEQAIAYRQRILDALPEGSDFQPLMTLYLTDNTGAEEIARSRESGLVHALKYYPAGATTNSDSGVTDMQKVLPVLKTMAELEIPLCIHGEVTDPAIDIFDREAVFIDTLLKPLMEQIPELRIVLEHITTADAVRFVESGGDNIAATITAHHLLENRNAMLVGGMHPHNYCLPVLKRESHRQALLKAATSGSSKYFLGTDSAPHPQHAKESACGCAGIYTAHAAMELYAEAFASVDALDRLEGFASFYGPDFYRLPRNQKTITLEQKEWQVPASLKLGSETLIPFRAGKTLHWRLVD